MNFRSLLTLVPFIFIGFGCGSGTSGSDGIVTNQGVKKENYSYELTNCKKFNFETNECEVVDCTTGHQAFTSKLAFCDALTNNYVNGGKVGEWNSCMLDSRIKLFNEQCTGSFVETGFAWTKTTITENGTGLKNNTCIIDPSEEQFFPSKAELCRVLQSDTLLPKCDLPIRKKMFTKLGCEGIFN